MWIRSLETSSDSCSTRALTKRPASASLHSLEPSWSAYLARAQSTHSPGPAPLDVPGGHGAHSLAPVAALDRPASHDVHEELCALLNVPTSHGSQELAPDPE